jgi:hypothetical protein
MGGMQLFHKGDAYRMAGQVLKSRDIFPILPTKPGEFIDQGRCMQGQIGGGFHKKTVRRKVGSMKADKNCLARLLATGAR